MKENEFLDSVSNIEIDVVERFASMDNKLQKKSNKQKTKGVWLRFGAVAACIALIVVAIIVVPMLREDDHGVIPGTTDDPVGDPHPNGTTNNNNPGNIRPLHWDDVSSFFGTTGESGNMGSPSEMYEEVFYEITSGVYSKYKHGSIISDDCVGEKIDTVVIRTGWYQSWNDEERDVYEVNAEVYKIEGVVSTVAVAI